MAQDTILSTDTVKDALLTKVNGDIAEVFAVAAGARTTVPKTANYSIQAADCTGNLLFTNTGATGGIEFSLPAVSANYRVSFLVTAAQYLKIIANGTQTIKWRDQTGAAGGYIRSNVAGTFITLDGGSGTCWYVTEIEFTWKVDV